MHLLVDHATEIQCNVNFDLSNFNNSKFVKCFAIFFIYLFLEKVLFTIRLKN